MRRKIIRKSVFLLVSLLVCITYALANTYTLKDVTAFGAKADDGKDDTSALRAAAAYCRNHPGTTLFFPPGIYQLRDENAIQLEKDVLSGKMGENPEKVIFTPYYPYIKGIDLLGAKDITILAHQATLLCEGWMEPISIDHCKNVRICGLTIDYKRKPFSTGEVTDITPQYFDIQFGDNHIITEKIPLMRMTFWLPEGNYMHPDPIYFPKRELLGNNKVRFHQSIPQHLVGSVAGVIHSFHFRPGILIHKSEDTRLDGVTIHSQPGMGIVGFDSKNIFIERLSVIPSSGYYFSTNTDATHFACCKGVIHFNGCHFRGQGDDATNVHGYYQTILSCQGNRAELQIKAPTYTHAQVADVPRIGDLLELVEINTLRPIRTYEVKGVNHEKKSIVCSVTLSDTLPANPRDYYLMNISKLPKLVFENSLIDSHLARGVLVKTRNVLIQNNVFRQGTGTAIHVGAEAGWHEGSHAKNVIIRNNLINKCGLGSGNQNGACGIAVNIMAQDISSSFLHDSIHIEGNLISGAGNPCGIYVGNADRVVLKQNQITNCKQNIHTHCVRNLQIDK